MSAERYSQQSLLEPISSINEVFENEMKGYQSVDEDEVDFMLPGMFTVEETENLIAFLLTQ